MVNLSSWSLKGKIGANNQLGKRIKKNQRRCKKCGRTISENDFRDFDGFCFDDYNRLEFSKAFQ